MPRSSRRSRRARRATRLLRTALAVATGSAAIAPALAAQKVSLRIHPQVGDTIHMRMDQMTEMTGTRRGKGDTTSTARSTTRLRARAIVQTVEPGASTVLAITDSVSVETSDGSRRSGDRARRAMEGRQVTVRIAADGSMDLSGDAAAAAAPELRGLFASMPPTLPREPVAVGDVWHRTIPVPSIANGGMRVGGMIRAVFTLDSLARDGDVAFISMRASLTREAAPSEVPRGARFVTTGVISGTMQVDRKRGWMTDSRTTVSVHSVATPPPGSDAEPVQFRMKITQWLRAVDKK